MKNKKIKKIYNIPVVVEKDEDGSFFCYAPSLQGCCTSGKNLNEALINIKDAISLYLQVLKEEQRNLPNRVPVSLTSLEIFA